METKNPTATKLRILDVAADLATTDGLEGLSFAQVAARLGLTKAGVARHFDGKAGLQAATIERVSDQYLTALQPALDAAPGLPRLQALMHAWLTLIEHIDFTGGCFFAATGSEFANRPGPLRESIASLTQALITSLEEQAQLALRLGELPTDTDAHELVFRLHALAGEANLRRQLLDDGSAFDSARAGVDALLQSQSNEEHSP
ncbi:MAG: TetR/AcrR family transcriptional regulator [Pseudomonadota bacterium]